MSGLTVQGIGRFTQYFDSINQFGNDTQEDLTLVSQVKNTHDPFGLRERYASRQGVIDTLDKIDAALAKFNRDENRHLNLSNIDFRSLNDLKVNRYEILNLDRFLTASQNISQYPLRSANLRRADLRGAFALFNNKQLTGNALKDYLVEHFKVEIDVATMF